MIRSLLFFLKPIGNDTFIKIVSLSDLSDLSLCSHHKLQFVFLFLFLLRTEKIGLGENSRGASSVRLRPYLSVANCDLGLPSLLRTSFYRSMKPVAWVVQGI